MRSYKIIKLKFRNYKKPKLIKIKDISPKELLKASTHLSDTPCGCSGCSS